MALTDLCTLAEAKAWLGIDTSITTSDAQIGGLITAASRIIYSYLNRPYLLPIQRTELRDGTGGPRLMLREWPVISVQSLTVDGILVPASPNPPYAPGYLLDPPDPYPPGAMQVLSLTSARFTRDIGNVTIVYTAGYQVSAEAWTVPGTPYQVTAQAPFGDFVVDTGVTYAATGAALTKVASAPATGQYAVDTTGKYTFAAGDAGQGVLINYGYVPADVRQAAIQLLGDLYSYRSHIGMTSKTLASQETVAFSTKDMSDTIKLQLSQYRRVVAP